MVGRLVAVLALLLAAYPALAAEARLKDVASVRGARGVALFGYGLVIGLNGSGDSGRGAPFTARAVRSMLDRLGVNVRGEALQTRNVAAVIVTAELPPFAGRGSRIDVAVASLGDARSLAGGTLVFTPLTAADGEVYAAAQGPVSAGGFAVAGQSETLSQGVPTAGRIANGAMVEREAAIDLDGRAELILELRNPDYATAVAVVDRLNAHARAAYGEALAAERDARSLVVRRPARISAARLLAEIGELQVPAAAPAVVVVDERTGTIVIGEQVRLSTVAVTHGSLTVRITETPAVSQPTPFSRGDTVVTSDTAIGAAEAGGQLAIVEGASLRGLVEGLNRIGLKPAGIIAILQAIKTAGALQAELVVQ